MTTTLAPGAVPVLGRVMEGVVRARTTPMQGAVELVVHQPVAAAEMKPGQFFQIAVGAANSLLRRPYSAAWSRPETGEIGFIFNVVGLGSAWLAGRKPGDTLDILGPLGRGFTLDGAADAICLAGGLGIAVFPGVVAALRRGKRRVTMLYGAGSAAKILGVDRFGDAEVRIATDDGSRGHRGRVTELLQAAPDVEIFACGPTPMLQALVHRARQVEIPLSSVQIALETPMGCGVGTCLGCVAPAARGGYLLTCQQGPCVRADVLDWSRMTDAFHG